jgi:hypothetical protein
MVREIQCTDESGCVMDPPNKKKTANSSETVYGEGSGPGLVPLNQEFGTPLHNTNKEKRKRKSRSEKVKGAGGSRKPSKIKSTP